MRRRARVANPRPSAWWARWALFSLVVAVAAAPIVVGVTAVRFWRRAAEGLPEVPDLAARPGEAPASSVIVAADGTELERQPFVDGEVVGDRTWVAYADLPPLLVHAILSAEDVRFMEHGGVDLRAVARAAWTNWRAGRTVEGASTLTQQVSRLIFPDVGRARTVERKLREAVIARRLERAWRKEAILEVWANEVYLGAGAYGVAAAARRTFGKSLAELDAAEAATIAGLAQAPATAHPFVSAAAARARRDEVLGRMRRAGFLDDAALAVALARPLDGTRPAGDGGGPAPWMVDAVRAELDARDPTLLAHGGLRIETTAATLAGGEAEAALVRGTQALGARQHAAAPEGAVVAIDHATGAIEALVGGTAWRGPGFDRALMACRQPGSAFKPIVYAAALAEGVITPGTVLLDAPVTDWDASFLSAWKPSNAGHAYRGPVRAVDALAASLNPPAIAVIDRVGPPAVIETARRLGITSDLAAVRPLALGSSCVRPLELARAFARLAEDGRVVEPRTIDRIVRLADGAVLVDEAAPEEPWLDPARRLDRLAARAARGRAQAIDGAAAWMTSWMLAAVVERGTGHDARALDRPAAGKTGTTNDAADAWFVGSTARVTAIAWVGHDKPAPLGPKEDGAHAALPIWMDVVRALEDGRPARALQGPPPDGVELQRTADGRAIAMPRGAILEELEAPEGARGIDDAAKDF